MYYIQNIQMNIDFTLKVPITYYLLINNYIVLSEKLVPCTLEEIFTFATGVPIPPSLGFDKQPTIEFLSEEAIFPQANTCALILKVPVFHNTYELFKEKFIYGIKEGMVFGFA